MDLSSVLPSYYDDNETMQELQGILSAVTEELEGGLQKTVDDSGREHPEMTCFPGMKRCSGCRQIPTSRTDTAEREFLQGWPELEPRRHL